MGISGLLPTLKSIVKPVHLSQYRGKKVAVDGYSWLHKGAYACSRELCEGLWTDKFVVYFMSRVELLRHNGVEPIIVFDGARLPIKSNEEESRHRTRRENREKAAAHLRAGNVAAAVECYQRSVDVSPAMAKQVIEALKERGVAFLVAPYEADAQMAYLARTGKVHAVLTEDSDLLTYGCPRVLFKLDKTGTGEEIQLEDLPHNKDLSFVGFSQDMFVEMCIMAGCDFLPSLSGIGMKKAHGIIKKCKGFVKACKNLRFTGVSVHKEYEPAFQRAIWAFRHQRVFCSQANRLVHLTPLPPGGIDTQNVEVLAALPTNPEDLAALNFLGPDIPPGTAAGIANGDLDPMTQQPFDLAAIYRGCPNPPHHLICLLPRPPSSQAVEPQHSFSGSQQPRSSQGARSSLPPRSNPGASRQGLPAQKNGILHYFSSAVSASSSKARRDFMAPRPSASTSAAASTQPEDSRPEKRQRTQPPSATYTPGAHLSPDDLPPLPHHLPRNRSGTNMHPLPSKPNSQPTFPHHRFPLQEQDLNISQPRLRPSPGLPKNQPLKHMPLLELNTQMHGKQTGDYRTQKSDDEPLPSISIEMHQATDSDSVGLGNHQTGPLHSDSDPFGMSDLNPPGRSGPYSVSGGATRKPMSALAALEAPSLSGTLSQGLSQFQSPSPALFPDDPLPRKTCPVMDDTEDGEEVISPLRSSAPPLKLPSSYRHHLPGRPTSVPFGGTSTSDSYAGLGDLDLATPADSDPEADRNGPRPYNIHMSNSSAQHLHGKSGVLPHNGHGRLRLPCPTSSDDDLMPHKESNGRSQLSFPDSADVLGAAINRGEHSVGEPSDGAPFNLDDITVSGLTGQSTEPEGVNSLSGRGAKNHPDWSEAPNVLTRITPSLPRQPGLPSCGEDELNVDMDLEMTTGDAGVGPMYRRSAVGQMLTSTSSATPGALSGPLPRVPHVHNPGTCRDTPKNTARHNPPLQTISRFFGTGPSSGGGGGATRIGGLLRHPQASKAAGGPGQQMFNGAGGSGAVARSQFDDEDNVYRGNDASCVVGGEWGTHAARHPEAGAGEQHAAMGGGVGPGAVDGGGEDDRLDDRGEGVGVDAGDMGGEAAGAMGSGGFHDTAHIQQYVQLARSAIDKVEVNLLDRFAFRSDAPRVKDRSLGRSTVDVDGSHRGMGGIGSNGDGVRIEEDAGAAQPMGGPQRFRGFGGGSCGDDTNRRHARPTQQVRPAGQMPIMSVMHTGVAKRGRGQEGEAGRQLRKPFAAPRVMGGGHGKQQGSIKDHLGGGFGRFAFGK